MDYAAAIATARDDVRCGRVDNAVMECLRIARHRKDYLSAAVFQRELRTDGDDLVRMLMQDGLSEEQARVVHEISLNRWLKVHELDFTISEENDGQERRVLSIAAGELDFDAEETQRSIADLEPPAGLDPSDVAAFADRTIRLRGQARLRIRAIRTIKERMKALCADYIIRIERELEGESTSVSFLEEVQRDVNNFFNQRCPAVYLVLQKGAQLAHALHPEDATLLLTEVRRALTAAADFFYPPTGEIQCSDGKIRVLGDENYLDRMQEFLASKLVSGSAKDLLRSELEYLAAFMRRLNRLSNKGVHAQVDAGEAKQGLVGLYMFLHNVCVRVERKETVDGASVESDASGR